jgi:hypothetical protein
MSIIQSIRQYFYRTSLNKHHNTHKKSSSKKITFENAKTIGLLFDANDLNIRNVVLKYGAALKKQGKKVKFLGFLDNKHETGDYTFDYYNLKNIDWAQRAKGESVEAFVKEPFDILITPVLKTNKHIEYIAAISNATIKAGPISEYAPDAYDVMVDVKDKNNLQELIKQIEAFLRKTQTAPKLLVS